MIDLGGHVLDAHLGVVFDLECVLRCLLMCHICKQSVVVLGPELLRLLEQEARLNRRVLLLRVLQAPPLLASELASELGQLAAVDPDRHRAELSSVVSDHLGSSALVQLLSCKLGGRHVR